MKLLDRIRNWDASDRWALYLVVGMALFFSLMVVGIVVAS